MPGCKDIATIWKNVKEIDLRPIRQEAEVPVSLALAGAPGVGRHTLAEQMKRDPNRHHQVTHTVIKISTLDAPDRIDGAELIMLMLDATRKDYKREQQLADHWRDAGRRTQGTRQRGAHDSG